MDINKYKAYLKEFKEKTKDNLSNTNFAIYKNIFGNITYINEYLKTLKDPLKVQEKTLKKIIKKNKNTEFGKKYNFNKIKTISDYQKQIPILDFEDIKEDIERIKNGEKNILTKDKVIYFASTSGTTSKIKLIPVTKERIKNFKREFTLWAMYNLVNHLSLLNGKTLYFAGPYFEGKTNSKKNYGSISGYLIYRAPWFIKKKITNPVRTYNIMNFNKKIKRMAIYALNKKITQIGFTAPIEAILFFDYIKNNKTRLLKELEKKNKKRALELKELNEFIPINIWPNLELISCFKSETNMLYIDTLQEKIGKKLTVKDPGINCSEGRISVGVCDDKTSGVPLAHVNFYEFIDINTNKILTIDKLKKNKKYKIILTTKEGLYRYNLGDIIIVTGFKNKLPEIKFYDRDRFLNIAGELAYEKELVKIANKTLKEMDLKIEGITYLPYIKNLDKKPRYEILIEPINKKINKEFAKKFINKIDENLQKEINDYMQMRNEFGRLEKPVLSILKKGSWKKYNKKRLTGPGNPKPIYLSKDLKFRDNFEIEKTFVD